MCMQVELGLKSGCQEVCSEAICMYGSIAHCDAVTYIATYGIKRVACIDVICKPKFIASKFHCNKQCFAVYSLKKPAYFVCLE